MTGETTEVAERILMRPEVIDWHRIPVRGGTCSRSRSGRRKAGSVLELANGDPT